MGSSSSKVEKKPESARNSKKAKPVANVNNQDAPAIHSHTNKNAARSEPPNQSEQRTFITQPEESVEERNNRINTTTVKDGLAENEDTPSWDPQSRQKPTTRDSFVWQADKETEDELNEVLQIPTDHRHSSSSRPTPQFQSYPAPVRQQDLPETYAQRKQREQYTLNQQMLLRQKTIYRNPDDWKNEDEEEESGKGGFDPSKFRSANTGQTTKSTVFTTNMKQDEDVQYMPGQQNMDDFDIDSRQKNSPRELPTYNQSEQDLMASLERELM